MLKDKIHQRVCKRCHKPSPAYLYITPDGKHNQICNTCKTNERKALRNLVRKMRRQEVAELNKEMKTKQKLAMQGLNIKKRALEKVVSLINKHLDEATIPPIAVPTFNSRKEIDQHLTSLRRIRQQYFTFTRINRNQLLRLERTLYNQGMNPDERTTKALTLRQYKQDIAAEAFKTSLDEYLSGNPWTDISEQYRDLLLVVKTP